MKTFFLSALCGCSLLFVVGCGFRAPKYQASALLMVGEPILDPSKIRQMGIMIATEVEAIEAIAASALTDQSQEFSVTPVGPNMILITLTADDPREAADVCNSIAETYTARQDDAVSRSIVEKAVPPENSM